MSMTEQANFLAAWQQETQSTMKLLQALPASQYDFRPDAGGRSLGELAWHLAEIDGYISEGVASRRFDFSLKLPGLERPRSVAALAEGYARVHAQAVARIAELSPADFDRPVPFMGRDIRAGELLWSMLLMHLIHHRGQLALMCRLAGGLTPGLYGPNREATAAMQAGAPAKN
jgi:uncharacterized damage-inducible protein DinB